MKSTVVHATFPKNNKPAPKLYPYSTGIVLPFEKPKKTSRCIFCNTTITLQFFKGKTVCCSCLEDIPILFLAGETH